MACADLVGGTTEQSCLFPDLVLKYQWYETLPNSFHHTSALPQPFLLLISANLALAGCLDWKWSLWPVLTWLVVQRSKCVFSWLYMIVSMIWNTSKLSQWHLSRATNVFVVDSCQFSATFVLGLTMVLLVAANLAHAQFRGLNRLMHSADLFGGTTEQSCLFPDLIWYYQWYEKLPNCLAHTPAVPQPLLLFITANFTLTAFIRWKWSL